MNAVFWIAGIVAGLVVIDRLGLWMESKGWLYWRKVKRKGSAAGLLAANAIFDPGERHAMDVREEKLIEEDKDNGDDESNPKPQAASPDVKQPATIRPISLA